MHTSNVLSSLNNRQAGQPTAHSLHTQAERSGPTTGQGSQQQ